ncbi:MAG: helix-turn-helix domain-containing protein [Tetragenococcus koreensis]|nr:helix-turn-helix domain-containing protein [Tetragenococcus koreensis]
MTNLALVDLDDLKVLIAESEVKNEVWNTQQAANYLNVSRATLTRAASKGEVPAVKFGSDWRFSSIALFKYVSNKEQASEVK